MTGLSLVRSRMRSRELRWGFVVSSLLVASATAQATPHDLSQLRRAHGDFHADKRHAPRCPQGPITGISLTIRKVKAREAAGGWNVASQSRQKIELFPASNLANQLGLTELPAGFYSGILIEVLHAEIVVAGHKKPLLVPHRMLWIDCSFLVRPGQPLVVTPDVDPEEAVALISEHHGSRGRAPQHACKRELVWKLRPVLHCLVEDVDFDGDQVADVLDNCPAVANPDQADGDGDQIGDACDSCAGGADTDADGVCDGLDNCLSVLNADQLDIDQDGLGDRCDSQSCFSPLSPEDEQLASLVILANPAVSSSLNGARSRLLEARPMCAERGPNAARHVRLAIYDYDGSRTIRALVNLNTLGVSGLNLASAAQPSFSAEERDEAIAVASAHPAVAPMLPAFDLGSTTVNVMRGELVPACLTQRCVNVVFQSAHDTGATFSPAEGYGDGAISWVGTRNELTVTVDMATLQVLHVQTL